MKKIKLPVSKTPIPDSKSLSMDEYLAFVQMHIKYTLNREEYEKQTEKERVFVPFKLN